MASWSHSQGVYTLIDQEVIAAQRILSSGMKFGLVATDLHFAHAEAVSTVRTNGFLGGAS